MAADSPADSFVYVYAVVPAGSAPQVEATGIDGALVGHVRCEAVAALTSSVGGPRVRPARANLLAHQSVVSCAYAAGPVLPVRFGTVMPESAVDADLLEADHDRLAAMLADFAGKDEFRIRCRYLTDVPLREIVETNRSVQRLRQRVRAGGPAAGRSTQVRLGELVFAEMEKVKERDAAAVFQRLAPHLLAWEPLEDRSDDTALHAAVLVERGEIAKMEAALEQISREQVQRIQLDLIGPLPPWDFSHVSAGAA